MVGVTRGMVGLMTCACVAGIESHSACPCLASSVCPLCFLSSVCLLCSLCLVGSVFLVFAEFHVFTVFFVSAVFLMFDEFSVSVVLIPCGCQVLCCLPYSLGLVTSVCLLWSSCLSSSEYLQ